MKQIALSGTFLGYMKSMKNNYLLFLGITSGYIFTLVALHVFQVQLNMEEMLMWYFIVSLPMESTLLQMVQELMPGFVAAALAGVLYCAFFGAWYVQLSVKYFAKHSTIDQKQLTFQGKMRPLIKHIGLFIGACFALAALFTFSNVWILPGLLDKMSIPLRWILLSLYIVPALAVVCQGLVTAKGEPILSYRGSWGKMFVVHTFSVGLLYCASQLFGVYLEVHIETSLTNKMMGINQLLSTNGLTMLGIMASAVFLGWMFFSQLLELFAYREQKMALSAGLASAFGLLGGQKLLFVLSGGLLGTAGVWGMIQIIELGITSPWLLVLYLSLNWMVVGLGMSVYFYWYSYSIVRWLVTHTAYPTDN
jgi:hypothetical protein